MFITRKEFYEAQGRLVDAHASLYREYSSLRHKYYTLLAHLGLEEVETPAKTELKPKGVVAGNG